jgi:predicted RNA-binding Zn-ribbon protein involved in translation (DUF1610 family)
MGILRRLFGQPAADPEPTTKPQASLPPRLPSPAEWPELPDSRHRGERELASLNCPYCGRALAEPPKAAKKRCPHCGELIIILTGPDERRHMMTADSRPIVQAEWSKALARRRAEADAAYKRDGILRGDAYYLSARGAVHYQPALERIAKARGDRFDCVARLVREPENLKDPQAIRVELDGEHVGYAKGEDWEQDDVLELLMELERRGRHAWVPAEVQRSRSNGKLYVELSGWLPTAEELD